MSEDNAFFDEGDTQEAPEVETDRPFPTNVIHALAKEVIAGKYGRGEARRALLGENYDQVIEEVRRIRLQGR